MKIFFSLIFLLAIFISNAQAICDCPKILSETSKQIENNSVSYAHQVLQNKNSKAYSQHKKLVEKSSKFAKNNIECLGVLQYYLSFLRDAHQEINITNQYYPFKSFADTTAVKEFIQKNVENISITDFDKNPIEGKWIYKSGIFSIDIFKNHSKGRLFVGVLDKDLKVNQQFLGYKGDLKVSFFNNYKNELCAIFWDFGQRPNFYKVTVTDQELRLGRNVVFYKDSTKVITATNYKPIESTYFESLNAQTNYFRIHTFDYENKKAIDSVLVANHDLIISKPNLIIDIRNNDGGSDYSYQQLLPYLLTQKKYQNAIIGSSYWMSKDNFKFLEAEKYTYGVSTKQDSIRQDEKIENLRKYIGEFTPYKQSSASLDSIYHKPENVYIIQNDRNASSAEGFVLLAKQSQKVKTFGVPTGGYMSYGEWRKLPIPDFPAWISLTQKRMVFQNDADYEMIGISPDILLDKNVEENWLKEILYFIDK